MIINNLFTPLFYGRNSSLCTLTPLGPKYIQRLTHGISKAHLVKIKSSASVIPHFLAFCSL